MNEREIKERIRCPLRGKYVIMAEHLKKALKNNDSAAHVKEFGDCVGIVAGFADYNNPGEKFDPKKLGPEVEVRWQPSNLLYHYAPRELRVVKSLCRMHTRELIELKNSSYFDTAYLDFGVVEQKLELEQKVIDGEVWGSQFTHEQIISELNKREHVPNKKEAKQKRKKGIKSANRVGRSDM